MLFIDIWIQQTLGEWDWLFRLFLSAVLGFLIGLNRTNRNKPAGVKTYMYVTTAAALITVISIQSVEMLAGIKEQTMMDPMRLAAQIVSGLGFIGAGIILKDGVRVFGLTSAAMIFFAGGMGIGVGVGFYTYVVFTLLVSRLFVRLGELIERKQKRAAELEKSRQET
jgi:putative Mg2+ transporter-C (MgtC) family protein